MSKKRDKEKKKIAEKREKDLQASVVMADQMVYNKTGEESHVESTFLYKEGEDVSYEEMREALHDVVDEQCAYFFLGLNESCKGNSWKNSSKDPVKIETLVATKEMPPEAMVHLLARAMHVIDDNLRRMAKAHAKHILRAGDYLEKDLPPDDELSTVAYFALWANMHTRMENMWLKETDKESPEYELGEVPPVPMLLFRVERGLDKLSPWKRYALFGQNTRAMFRMGDEELKEKFNLEVL